jgi:hypothetical protein
MLENISQVISPGIRINNGGGDGSSAACAAVYTCIIMFSPE